MADADFLEYYGKDLREEWEKDAVRAAGLLGNLPRSSRLYEELVGGPAFDQRDATYMLMEHWLHTLVWMKTKDGSKNRNAPKLELPEYVEQAQKRAEEAAFNRKLNFLQEMTPDEIRAEVYGNDFN